MLNDVDKIVVNWLDDEPHCVRMVFAQQWAWEGFYHAQKQANLMISAGPGTVDLVYQFDERTTLPRRYYHHLVRIERTYPQNLGMVLWVGCNSLVVGFIRSVTRSYPNLARRYAFVDTMDEVRLIAGP